ncbi:endoribonuclease Dicer-like isoform X1 [Schistocerca americana]|uniref:endoribonuclease Dicer-like isoform X1 n=2 Tax=Schistocerca americana TaxID=7009 RepID=UPI001F4F635E|nr:endoribonuclease Dicer-like isoform X1 [Schistocerca americana]
MPITGDRAAVKQRAQGEQYWQVNKRAKMSEEGQWFNPRKYQESLLELCIKQNTILYLPTGAGKTFIAVMLIRKLMDQCASDPDRKVAVFAANTVALVGQQAEYIRRHTDLSVGIYTGLQNVDFWKPDRWQKEFATHEVLVMSSQVVLNVLQHGYLDAKKLQVIVFDECHRAVNDQPMKKVMDALITKEATPRVLGLTGTLLNCNCKPSEVPRLLKELETTFRSKIATILNSEEIQSFSTNPEEMLMNYDKSEEAEALQRARRMLEDCEDFILSVDFTEDSTLEIDGPDHSHLMIDKKKINKKLRNVLGDVRYQLGEVGVYGGYLATLLHKVELIRWQQHAENSTISVLLETMVTTLHCVGKLLYDEMECTPEKEHLFQFSSKKLLALVSFIQKLFAEEMKIMEAEKDDGKRRRKFTVLVFVDRRSSAKLLYQIFKFLSLSDPKYEGLHPDFVVGFAAQQYTKENDLEKKRNQEALDKFKAGETNILVSSDVLEEGVDIPMCNTVIRFDPPKTFRSYVQSKGRARHKTSTFHILTERGDSKFYNAMLQFKEIERELYKILNYMASIVNDPYEEDDVPMDDDVEDEVWYVPGGEAYVAVSTAVVTISIYCSRLPQDKFTDLSPLWYIQNNRDSTVTCYLKLPMNSRLKEPVKGRPQSNRKMAKRYAAFETVKRLYQCGELDDHLCAVSYEKDVMSYLTFFPFIKREAVPKGKPEAGTKKRKQLYTRKYPELLCSCQPQSDRPAYMHLIRVTPVYPSPPPDKSRKIAFYNIFKELNGYAILSAKKIPTLCDFPIFTNEGQMDVTISSNYKEYVLSEEKVNLCLGFRKLLFGYVLDLLKDFMAFDDRNEGNSYFVVPVTYRNDQIAYDIDWNVMETYKKIEPITRRSLEQRSVPIEDYSIYHHAVVAPWYRGLPPTPLYIVTKVCEDMSPQTPFPSPDVSSYEDYFVSKYNLTIVQKEQPLLEVKSIPKTLNWLRPRSSPESQQHLSKRKRLEQQKDFEEHLVPELCGSHSFPGGLWLKAIYLPTVLHRVTQMLHAEEFRSTVARETGLGPVDHPQDFRWRPLKDESFPEEIIEQDFIPVQSGMDNAVVSEDSPIDLDRALVSDIAGIDILLYDKYCNGGIDTEDQERKNTYDGDTLMENGLGDGNEESFTAAIAVPSIKLLDVHGGVVGPQLAEVLKALTAASSHDVFNSERLETLGDSFLKFSVSLFLFIHFDHLSEGALTVFKNYIVGNSHFYNIAKHKQLGGILQVHDFTPKDGWLPPGITVPKKVRSLMLEQNVSPNFLYRLELSEEEQQTGVVADETIADVKEQLGEWDQDPSVHSSMEDYLGVQTVNDKAMADSVEALIGVYLNEFGVEGALRFVNWLKILPVEHASPQNILKSPPPSPILGTGSARELDFHLENAARLEKILGYKFQNRGYLLQALSHASYIQNRITDCYQRLEFLGDAILDFLITSYLFETYSDLTPGQLTDLRSALVNNNTFAAYTVKYSIHKYCRYSSLELFHKVDAFVRYQEAHDHKVTDEVLLLLEEDDTLAEAVDVPKVLGDLFESVAGAIFLDSGKCLKTVWNVYYKLMENEIKIFAETIPKSAVRQLYEKCKVRPEFSEATKTSEPNILAVTVEVILQDERKVYYGFGTTKKAAKTAAAKAALKDIHKNDRKL